MTYTYDQSQALQALIDWIELPDAPIFQLTGAAGTGKTTMLNSFIQYCDEMQINYALTAPTHKARLVLSEKLNKETFTLQSLLGFSPDVDLEKPDALRKFKPRHKPKIEGLDVVPIDESSMIAGDMLMYLRQQATKVGAKIIFAGDKFQLPPVQEDEAVALTMSNPYGYELKQIVRQAADSPLSALLLAMRNDIYFLEAKHIDNVVLTALYQAVEQHYPNLMDKLQGFAFQGYATQYLLENITNNDAVIILESSKEVAPIYKENPAIKMLMFKNSSVDLYNKAARNLLGYTGIVNVGERLMGYRNISDEDTIVLINGLEYTVRSVNGPYTMRDMPYLSVALTPDLTNSWDTTVRIIGQDAVAGMFKHSMQLVNEAMMSRKWDNVHQFHKDWVPIVDWQQQYKDKPMPQGFQTLKHWQLLPLGIKYGYALTIHKSQGSTYDEVLVDLNDLPIHRKDVSGRIFALKLLYVAVSRARHKAYLIRNTVKEDYERASKKARS